MLDFHEGLGGWLAGSLAGWSAGWLAGRFIVPPKRVKTRSVSTKLHPRDPDERRKCNPFNKNSVENATPSCRNCVSGCLTASFGEHFGVPKIAPLNLK